MDMKQPTRILAGAVATLACGCATTAPDRAECVQRGYVYYLDGAGGGGIINWSGRVRQGLRDAGYDGWGEMYTWETGLGVVADQTASNEYKRGKAAELAGKMVEYHREYPDAPMTLMGLSAGTAIAVFTLESLPADVMVENVILLSGSLSAIYDLSKALRRVRGKMYVTTSQRDAVLGALLQFAGTADRDSGTDATIGVEGPQLPHGASQDTRQLYASNLAVVPCQREYALYGNRGGHTDAVAAPFIEHYVAPLVKTKSGQQFAAAKSRPSASRVANPDYQRWARFPVGSWALFERRLTADGTTRPVRVKVTLVSKSASALSLLREQFDVEGRPEDAPFPQQVYASAQIAPDEHPMTHPARQTRDLPDAGVNVGGREFGCRVQSVSTDVEFRDWGRRPQATVYLNDEVPGGTLQLELKTRFAQNPVVVSARLADYHVVVGRPATGSGGGHGQTDGL